jgi:hypothetical protein
VLRPAGARSLLDRTPQLCLTRWRRPAPQQARKNRRPSAFQAEHAVMEVDSRRVHAAAAAALFRDLGQEQPGARDAAGKSYEYRHDQDVESRGHSEG